MTLRPVLLDSGPLGGLAKANGSQALRDWLRALLGAGRTVIVPEAADYEIRRELIRIKADRSVHRLDTLGRSLTYLPLDTAAWRVAADLWARARQQGRPTAHEHALDADVLIAAQAMATQGIVATGNATHLGRFVDARDWQAIHPTTS